MQFKNPFKKLSWLQELTRAYCPIEEEENNCDGIWHLPRYFYCSTEALATFKEVNIVDRKKNLSVQKLDIHGMRSMSVRFSEVMSLLRSSG